MPTTISGSTGVDKVQDGSINQIDLAADVQQLGVGQTWQNMTASRALSTIYTNLTGKPITVSVAARPSTSSTVFVEIGGLPISSIGCQSAGYDVTSVFIVPAGATYKVSFNAGSPTVSFWMELR